MGSRTIEKGKYRVWPGQQGVDWSRELREGVPAERERAEGNKLIMVVVGSRVFCYLYFVRVYYCPYAYDDACTFQLSASCAAYQK